MKKRSDDEQRKRRDNDGLHKRRGFWYYTLVINGRRKFFSTGTKNYQEARTKRTEAITAQKENRLPNDLSKWAFDKLLARVLEDRKPHLAPVTIRLEFDCSKPLARHFGSSRVSTIDAAAIRKYQSARATQVSNRTVNLEIKLLRQVLKAAKTWSVISDDYKALPEDRRGPGRAIEEAQERLLFDTARSKPGWDAAFYAAVVAANTTMRGVEIKNLRIANINLIDREVCIQRSKGNTAGIRNIPLNDAAVWAFARLLERARAFGSTEPEHFLMPTFNFKRTGSTIRVTGYDPEQHQKSWRTAWRALVKETGRRAGRKAAKEVIDAGRGWRAGVSAWRRAVDEYRGLRFHDLRHLAITKLAESNASDSTIMAVAGHLSREMMEHYSHVRMAAKRKAVDAIRSYVPADEKPVRETTGKPQ